MVHCRGGETVMKAPVASGLGVPPHVRQVLVVGAGRSGLAATRALLGRDLCVRLSDTAPVPEETTAALAAVGRGTLEVAWGPQDAALLDGVDLVVKSPGVPAGVPLVAAAHLRGTPVWSEIELGYRLLANPIHAITGTNGKTTTTALLGHMFATAGRRVRVLGNIGTPLSAAVGEVEPEVDLVVEVSSFQLEDIHEFAPRSAVLLNLTQDHLDRHGSLDAYLAIKTRVFCRQGPRDVAVLNADDPLVAGVGRELAERLEGPAVLQFSAMGLSSAASRLQDDRLILCGRRSIRVAELSLKGLHNVENCLAAATVALAEGVEIAAAEEALRTFAGVPHRLQPAGSVDGVQYVNDSKATNVEATLKALTAYPSGVHLILGGRDKGSNYEPLARACVGSCCAVYLIGEAAPMIRAAFEKVRKDRDLVGRPQPALMAAGDLERAVHLAAAAARPGEVVLLAPACASFDQYQDFEERGRHFMGLVAGLGSGSKD